MSYFDIQEAVLQRWNDQPSRNQWLGHGCYWELVVTSLVGDRLPSNPPSEAYVTAMLHNHLKSLRAQELTLENLVTETYEILEKEKV